MSPLVYWQLDVFAERPLAGNGVAIFPDARQLSPAAMQALTRELRQFESVFLLPGASTADYQARIFTMEEELPFAGHPIIGTAALLHHLHCPGASAEWTLHLSAKSVTVRTRRQERGFYAEMAQGVSEFGAQLDSDQALLFAEAFSLSAADLDSRYPATVVSNGLPYLLLPVTSQGLALAKQRRAFEAELAALGADFVFLLDVDGREGRTWDPLGLIEDIATGSAAGPVAAFLVQHGLQQRGEPFSLNQGRFLDRPSRLDVCVAGDGSVSVGGSVQLLARGELLVAAAELG
ncbi:PhzF family phenazine biosynthesis protein [Pseudomonas sp. CrR25]|nr:PhzF family phenazine biosynthesis protein [Pseudomonas sp. CrR25]